MCSAVLMKPASTFLFGCNDRLAKRQAGTQVSTGTDGVPVYAGFAQCPVEGCGEWLCTVETDGRSELSNHINGNHARTPCAGPAHKAAVRRLGGPAAVTIEAINAAAGDVQQVSASMPQKR